MNSIEKIHQFEKFGSILGLERITGLMEGLGNPQENLNIIHVAGTNGKGSCSRLIYQALREEGYRVGLYTSPYLEKFNERIELDGQMITDEEIDYYTEIVTGEVENMVARGLESPTEFDVVTAMAFCYFAERKVDWLVLEVGLGGRGDSTNVITKPQASVFTSISYDHCDRLGNTLEKIAFEKAGIIKMGCPVINGVRSVDAKSVILEKAAELRCPTLDCSVTEYRILERGLWGSRFSCSLLGEDFDLKISMAGDHQVENAVTALGTLVFLREIGSLDITSRSIEEGFAKAVNPGRMEVLSYDPLWIIDGAHNQAGAKALADSVLMLTGDKDRVMIIGILADKEVDKILDEFFRITDRFIVTEPDNPRKMKCDDLSDIIRERGGKAISFADPEMAVNYGKTLEDSGVICAGSLYLIGMIRRIFIHEEYDQ